MTDTTVIERMAKAAYAAKRFPERDDMGSGVRWEGLAQFQRDDLINQQRAALAAQPSAGAQGEADSGYDDLEGLHPVSPSLFATPAQPDTGYTDAFYQLAEMMGLPATPQSPRYMWETIMQPRLQELLDQPDTGDVAALRLDMAAIGAQAKMMVSEIERLPAKSDPVAVHNLTYYLENITEWSGRYAALSKPNAPRREG